MEITDEEACGLVSLSSIEVKTIEEVLTLGGYALRDQARVTSLMLRVKRSLRLRSIGFKKELKSVQQRGEDTQNKLVQEKNW